MGMHVRRKQIAASSRFASRKVSLGIGIPLVAVVGIGIAVFAGRSDRKGTQATAPASLVDAAANLAVLPVVNVYKSPTCGCCSKWVEHLRDDGFTVRTTDTTDLATVKATHRVPPHLESCHTAVVDGYVVEGHVPAAEVRRLLKERPGIAGIAVAGMPIGSPGMEVPGARTQAYDVMAFDKDGGAHVFAMHGR